MTRTTADLRYALRAFLRRPGTSGLAVASLALGIGASTAMFSVVDSVLLAPLPYEAPEELVHVYRADPGAVYRTDPGHVFRGVFSLPEYEWIAEHQTVFEEVGGFFEWGDLTLTGDGPPEELDLVRATPGLLATLGVEALRGRLFGSEDHPREGARSVMLTERFWRERFAGSPEVVGSTLRLDDEAYTVVGVLPASVDVVTERADAWVLVVASAETPAWGQHSLTRIVGRLRDGVSAEDAEAEVERILTSIPADVNHGHAASVFPAHDDTVRRVRTPLTVLVVGAFLLLAVGCGNVALLLLGAGVDRERELAVRGALGAGRGRLARQLLTESLGLGAAGAVAGVFLAFGLTEALLLLAPADVPRIEQAAIDGRVLGFAVLVSLAASLLFGLAPALGLSRPDLSATINAARGSSHGKSRVQSAVVVGELALATVLLVSAGLLGRTLLALDRVDLGLDAEGLYAVRASLPHHRFRGDRFAGDTTRARVALDGYVQSLVDAAEGVPGVASVTVANNVPLGPERTNNALVPEGWEAEAEDDILVAERRQVSAGYFETLGIELVEGRGFEPADDRADAAPVMVVSEGLAHRVWPGASALGRRIAFWGRAPATVVGVAPDLRDESLTRTSAYAFYVPARQLGAPAGSLLLRLEGDPTSVLPALRERIRAVDPDLPLTRIVSIGELAAEASAGERYRARLMFVFALLASSLALLGVYGVVARSVARRTREFGVRLALGAPSLDVHTLVLGRGVKLAAAGAFIGLVASLWTARFLEDLLFGVEPLDGPTMAAVAGLVGVASIVAALPPARRATRVDPTEALRAEG